MRSMFLMLNTLAGRAKYVCNVLHLMALLQTIFVHMCTIFVLYLYYIHDSFHDMSWLSACVLEEALGSSVRWPTRSVCSSAPRRIPPVFSGHVTDIKMDIYKSLQFHVKFLPTESTPSKLLRNWSGRFHRKRFVELISAVVVPLGVFLRGGENWCAVTWMQSLAFKRSVFVFLGFLDYFINSRPFGHQHSKNNIFIYIHILGIRKFRINNQENSGLKSDTANLKIISHQASKHRKRTLHNNS